MTDGRFSDETLMLYADGELDEEQAARLERAMEHDEDLVARVSVFLETRSLARDAMAPLLHEPLPEKMVWAVEGMIAEHAKSPPAAPSVVVPLRDVRPAGAQIARWTLPLAASLAAVIAGAAGYLAGSSGNRPVDELQIAGVIGPGISDALATIPSGEPVAIGESSRRFRAIASFRDDRKALCREFEVADAQTTVVSVACRSDGKWRVNFAVVAPGDGQGYAPASSLEALDAYLASIGAESPMSDENEARALSE